MTDDQFSQVMTVLNNINDVMLFNAYYDQIYQGVIFGSIIAIILILAFRGIQ